MDTKSR